MNELEYTLVRTDRKTAAIYIRRDGTVEVRAPKRMALRDIERMLADKKEWIEKHKAEREKNTESKKTFALNDGDELLYIGNKYPLVLDPCAAAASFDGQKFVSPAIDGTASRDALVRLYIKLAKDELTKRVERYSAVTGLKATSVGITRAKTRWGSCSGRCSVNFSWRVIMADGEAIDYVVIHELAHTVEHNHSARFWALVGSIMPKDCYKSAEARLKALARRLAAENWE
jgi:predicted metal-dependent hydrolase